ncbi:hypothetical protein GLOIN_2v1763409 [Rhizophagus clarus]|uniref:Uncharacterized protein n=1 Tax=Rhizophagus clarus TaxID=94130 RepID=A0A8H3QT61_9GLOM|nr:hypothetical protein GLOIN_2v1763409 [Rhizophagus clarus]
MLRLFRNINNILPDGSSAYPKIAASKFDRNLIASEVCYYLEFQEYPNTSETGFASIYNISGWDESEAKEAFSLTNIQYSYVSKEQHRCLSIKVCEFASKDVFAKAHEYKCEHVNQNGIRCNGAPKLGELTQASGSITSKKKFIGCTNWKPKEKNYRYLTILINVDLKLLETMFNNYSYHPHGIDYENNNKSDAIEECFMVQPNSTRSDECYK